MSDRHRSSPSPSLVVLAAVLLLAVARRRDTDAATGALAARPARGTAAASS